MVKLIFILTILFSWLATTSGYTQKDPISRMYWNNYSVINPANSGFEQERFIAIQYRDQWVGSHGTPKTVWTIAETYIEPINSGLVINHMYDEIGNFRKNYFNINYNYQINLCPEHVLSAALAVGIYRLGIVDDWVYFDLYPDRAIPFAYPMYEANLNAGLMYRFKNLSLGIS